MYMKHFLYLFSRIHMEEEKKRHILKVYCGINSSQVIREEVYFQRDKLI